MGGDIRRGFGGFLGLFVAHGVVNVGVRSVWKTGGYWDNRFRTRCGAVTSLEIRFSCECVEFRRTALDEGFGSFEVRDGSYRSVTLDDRSV